MNFNSVILMYIPNDFFVYTYKRMFNLINSKTKNIVHTQYKKRFPVGLFGVIVLLLFLTILDDFFGVNFKKIVIGGVIW